MDSCVKTVYAQVTHITGGVHGFIQLQPDGHMHVFSIRKTSLKRLI